MATVGTTGAIRKPPANSGALGQGVAYPLTYDPITGRLMLSAGVDSVTDAVTSIFLTQPGERPMQPDYGANAGLFEPAVDVERLLIKARQNIAEHEPRVASIDNVNVQLGQGNGELTVTVFYSLIGDDTPRILTFPFFTMDTSL